MPPAFDRTPACEPGGPVPWTLVDVSLGLLWLVVWIFAAQGCALLVHHLEVDVSPGLLVSLLQIPLLLPVWWFTVRKYGCPWQSLGLTRFRAAVLLTGLGLMVLAVTFNVFYGSVLARYGLEAQPDLQRVFEHVDSPWPLVFGGVVLAPLVEELFFRGFLFAGLLKRLHWKPAMVISAALFSVVHLQPLAAPPIFALGLIFAYLYHRSGSIWPAIILHLLMNGLALGSALVRTGA